MTNTRPDLSLSRLELVVLARLSTANPPSEATVIKAVADLAPPGKQSTAKGTTATTLAELRRRGLVHAQRRTLTDGGNRALRAAFDLEKTPLWKDIHQSHLLARALGLKPGSDDTQKVLKDVHTLASAIVKSKFNVTDPSEIADKLIAEKLGLPPGPITLARMRAHVLAGRFNVTFAATPKEILRQIAEKHIGDGCHDKRTMSRVIVGRWVYEVTPSTDGAVVNSPRGAAVQSQLPLHTDPVKPSTSVKPPPGTSVIPPRGAATADHLLTLVRDAIPRVGADGRFGVEKVFVSALWHHIERDGRPADLSFDRFKRWLITANRDQLIDLARADLLGSMDPKLVAESEIEDLGAIFHFVVDRKASTASRGVHAR